MRTSSTLPRDSGKTFRSFRRAPILPSFYAGRPKASIKRWWGTVKQSLQRLTLCYTAKLEEGLEQRFQQDVQTHSGGRLHAFVPTRDSAALSEVEGYSALANDYVEVPYLCVISKSSSSTCFVLYFNSLPHDVIHLRVI